MSILEMVRGEQCLDYIDRPVGFCAENPAGASLENLNTGTNIYCERSIDCLVGYYNANTSICKWLHDTTKRKIGYVTNRYEDGGLYVTVLGSENVGTHMNGYNDKFVMYQHQLKGVTAVEYDTDIITLKKIRHDNFNYYPYYDTRDGGIVYARRNESDLQLWDGWNIIPFDDTLDYQPSIETSTRWEQSLAEMPSNGTLTNDVNTTMKFGQGVVGLSYIWGDFRDNPLGFLAGDLYYAGSYFPHIIRDACPRELDPDAFFNFDLDLQMMIDSYNGVAIPFNLILTESEQFAHEYITNGTLPPDAFLYPLDWSALPQYDGTVPSGDMPDDNPNDNTPDDDTRDFDPTPIETPTFTVNQLTNYNWYWLTVGEWTGFLDWFWNDIGDFSDFDDIIAKVKGLYNDLASAVIMCRYYPVDVSWIGGTGNQDHIRLGMIEKQGSVDTLANTALRAQDIGHIKISDKYKSFMDLSPYSQLSLYLPFHGFVDIDINLFSGHDLYVKALYDFMSGTIQYYLYYDNEFLVNTIICKMAMDIPITLQTKSDRDNAIFNNVSSTLSGLIGAGVGIASGNPIGMALGVTQGVSALNSSNASAPMRLMGNVGESGAYIAPQKCYVVVRRPTIQPSNGSSESSVGKNLNTWKSNIGQMCGYGYTLSDLKGKGFTTCHTPRINFTSTTPLQTEVDEIYDYLEKGVIL